MVKRPKISIMPPVPRGPVCEKMCERCPFKPDGTGYAQGHPDMPAIVQSVELGLPFYCHETALMDERTTKDVEGNPDPTYQAHFELCRGGHERRMRVWEGKARKVMLLGKVMEHGGTLRGAVTDVVDDETGTMVEIGGLFVPWEHCKEIG